jgi:hypothetical protein
MKNLEIRPVLAVGHQDPLSQVASLNFSLFRTIPLPLEPYDFPLRVGLDRKL